MIYQISQIQDQGIKSKSRSVLNRSGWFLSVNSTHTQCSIHYSVTGISLPGRQNGTVGLDLLSLAQDDEVAVVAWLQEIPEVLLQLGSWCGLHQFHPVPSRVLLLLLRTWLLYWRQTWAWWRLKSEDTLTWWKVYTMHTMQYCSRQCEMRTYVTWYYLER